MSKREKDDKNLRCHCGNPLPCSQHTGVDGDIDSATATPDEFGIIEGNRDN